MIYNMLEKKLANSQLQLEIRNIKATIQKIEKISSKFKHVQNEKINRVALFQVEIKHTHEFLIKLGCDYYAQLRTEQALQLMNLKLNHYQSQLHAHKQQQATKEKNDASKQATDKEKPKSVQLENQKQGFLQFIGEQNGQEIYNILEVDEKDEQNEEKNEKQGDYSQSIENRSELPIPSEHKEELSIKSANIEGQNNRKTEDEQRYEPEQEEQNLSQHESSEQEQDDEYDDIVISQRAKLGIDQELNDFIPPGHKISELTKIEEEPVREEEKIKLKVQKKEQKEEIPVKISRFKLERMKEKLEKQL